MKSRIMISAMMQLAGPQVDAQDSDVTFFVIGEHGNSEQSLIGVSHGNN